MTALGHGLLVNVGIILANLGHTADNLLLIWVDKRLNQANFGLLQTIIWANLGLVFVSLRLMQPTWV